MRPTKTAEQVLGLPEYDPFERFVADTPELAEKHNCKLGDTVCRYKVSRLSSIGIEGDDIMFCTDEHGEAWSPVCVEGVWYRKLAWQI